MCRFSASSRRRPLRIVVYLALFGTVPGGAHPMQDWYFYPVRLMSPAPDPGGARPPHRPGGAFLVRSRRWPVWTSPAMYDRQSGVRSRADRAALELVRLVLADDWTPEAAAERLRAHVGGDRAVLRLLRACVAKVNLERSTPVGVRASLTLECTISGGTPPYLATETLRAG